MTGGPGEAMMGGGREGGFLHRLSGENRPSFRRGHTGLFLRDIHSGVMVDVWRAKQTGKKIHLIKINQAGKVYFDGEVDRVEYEHVGVLMVDYLAAGYMGTAGQELRSTDNIVLGTKGSRVILRFKRGTTVENEVRSMGEKARCVRGTEGTIQDERLLNWILDQVGKDKQWLLDQFAGSDASVTLPGRGMSREYSVLSWNCNTFTAWAMDIYLGYRWYHRDVPMDGTTLFNDWDKAVRLGWRYRYAPGLPLDRRDVSPLTP